MLSRLLTYALFPVCFSSALIVAFYAAAVGWSEPLTLAGITVVAIAIIAVAERLNPYHSVWNQSHDDVPTDVAHATVSMVLLPPLIEAALTVGLVAVTARLATEEGGSFWPHQSPLFLQLALALVTTQFFEYWVHRLCHERPLLWRLHATHHSPRRLYWLNAGRFHPLDTLLSFGSAAAFLILLGVSSKIIFLLSVWISVHGLFQHCNVDIRLGPLNYIFSQAELHRWHHSLVLEEANSNYGNNIILWDLVFGTFFWPKERRPSAHIGLSDLPSFPTRYWAQVASPFRWARCAAPQAEEESTEQQQV